MINLGWLSNCLYSLKLLVSGNSAALMMLSIKLLWNLLAEYLPPNSQELLRWSFLQQSYTRLGGHPQMSVLIGQLCRSDIPLFWCGTGKFTKSLPVYDFYSRVHIKWQPLLAFGSRQPKLISVPWVVVFKSKCNSWCWYLQKDAVATVIVNGHIDVESDLIMSCYPLHHNRAVLSLWE